MSKVIVIGGGLAGLSAAHTILENGGSVLLLDKSAFLGGNSTKATSGINGKFLCFEGNFSLFLRLFFVCFARVNWIDSSLCLSLFSLFLSKTKKSDDDDLRTLRANALSLRKEREREIQYYIKKRAPCLSRVKKFVF